VYVATTAQFWELYDLFPARIRLAVRDESTRTAVEAVLTARTEQGRNRAFGP